ncbi:MAG: nitroreductase family protein [Candidatus Bipolaricaulota bacterium]
MDVHIAIEKRRSVRRFKERRVPREDLERLVDYARLAPSGMNKQPLEYVIVDDPELEREFFDYTSWAGSVAWSPGKAERPKAYIVILYNTNVEPVTEREDSGLAAENVMLGAVEAGLGSCPLGALEEDEIRELLSIPDDRSVCFAIGLGYPDGSIELEDGESETDYWLDDDEVLHVPKKPREAILHVNGW